MVAWDKEVRPFRGSSSDTCTKKRMEVLLLPTILQIPQNELYTSSNVLGHIWAPAARRSLSKIADERCFGKWHQKNFSLKKLGGRPHRRTDQRPV